jgi:hypothetical protein
MWPHPRLARVDASRNNAELYEEADGLTYLLENGLSFSVLDSSPFPWNPLARTLSDSSGRCCVISAQRQALPEWA